MPTLPVPSSTQRGFTLIEILVSTTIMVVLVGSGIVVYSTFNTNQQVVEGARLTQTWMRIGQSRARSNEKPPGCTKLFSYRFRLTDESSEATLVAVCNEPNEELNEQTFTLPPEVISDTTLTLDFPVLRGGIIFDNGPALFSDVTIKEDAEFNPFQYRFRVTKGGEIREGAKL